MLNNLRGTIFSAYESARKHASFTNALNRSGLSANTWWPAPFTACTFTLFLVSLRRLQFSCWIHEREPYSSVIGISDRNLSMRFSIGFLAQPNPTIIEWKALSPLETKQVFFFQGYLLYNQLTSVFEHYIDECTEQSHFLCPFRIADVRWISESNPVGKTPQIADRTDRPLASTTADSLALEPWRWLARRAVL